MQRVARRLVPVPQVSWQLLRGFSSSQKFQHSPALITVALCGDVHDQKRSPGVPITPEEQIDSALAAYEAGARLCHVHAREDDGSPSWRGERYRKVVEGVKRHAPDMLIEVSTTNFAPTLAEREECLDVGADLASLTPGSTNLKATRPIQNDLKARGLNVAMYLNSWDHIHGLARNLSERNIMPDVGIFDVSMLYHTEDLLRLKLLSRPLRIQYVMGGHMALPARRSLLEFLVSETRQVLGEDGWSWGTVGVGWTHREIARWALELGGHPRTGLEDTLMIRRGRLAASNAELVGSLVELCEEVGRPVANGREAREILGLQPLEPRSTSDQTTSSHASYSTSSPQPMAL
mmetsp:Transcript_65838/g.155519  ORF Transcript_65838/g.155519 Transcript_65838/m.155519 type:complete len:348 (+) Transcript_65838:30-1073(+)